MGWIPGTRAAASEPPASLAELGAQLAELHPQLDILIFALDAEQDVQSLRVPLASRLAELGVKTKVAVAGPGRVDAVLEGQLTQHTALVLVLATSDDSAQDRLMDLVQWLIANGRESLAKHLIFAPVGKPQKTAASFPFRHVPLARLDSALNVRGGAPITWRTTSGKPNPLLFAVLDQALGLE